MQNHTLKFSEWLEQRDPELFIEMDMSRRSFLGTVGAAATSMIGKKAFGNNDDDEDNRDPCEEMKNSQRRIASLESSLAFTNFDASPSYNKLINKHKPFTDSKVGIDYQKYFPDPHGTMHNPYKSTFPTAGGGGDYEVQKEYENHIGYIKNQKSADLKTVKYLEDKIKNLKKNPTLNQEEIQHYEKIIDIHNHIMKNGVSKNGYEISAKPTKDHHPHQDYYEDMKKIADINKSHEALLTSVADARRRLTDEEGLFDQLRISCERKIDDIIYKKLKSQHGENTLNISPKDTLYILKHGSKGDYGKLKELAEELGKSNIGRLNSSQVNELISDNFESGEYFKTLINILGTEKIKLMFPSIDLLLRNFYKFVENSYDNYLQDVFDFIIGKRNLINLPVEKVFIVLYTSYLISRSGKLKDGDEKYISIIIKNLGMHNMAKLGKAHWNDLDKVFGNKYGVNVIEKVYEKMKPKTYAPQFGE